MSPRLGILLLCAAGCGSTAAPPEPDGVGALLLAFDDLGGSAGWRSPVDDTVDQGLWADVDDDGLLDLTLLRSRADAFGRWGSLTRYANVGRDLELVVNDLLRFGAPGACWADLDRDGDPDLVLLEGPSAGLFDTPRGPRFVLRENTGDGLVEAWERGLDTDDAAGALHCADVDGDGLVEAFELHPDGVRRWDLSAWEASRSVVGGIAARDAAWVDVDRDGDLDLTLATDEGVRWLRNDGGALVPEPEPLLATEQPVTSISWADWLRDGRMHPAIVTGDLAIAYRAGTPWQERLRLPRTYAKPTAVEWADFDADGDADLAVGWDDGTVEVVEAFRSFTGQLLEPAWSSGTGLAAVSALDAADWDGDGDPDLLVGRATDSTAGDVIITAVYESQGGVAAGEPVGPVANAEHVIETDRDGDGRPDLLVARSYGRLPAWSDLAWARIDDDGRLVIEDAWFAFSRPASGEEGTRIVDLDAGDWDADGDLDFAMATTTGLVLLETHDGAPVPFYTDPDRTMCYGIGLGDGDADGDLDVLVNCFSGARILEQRDGVFREVWRGPGATGTPNVEHPLASATWAHLDGDGRMLPVWVDVRDRQLSVADRLADGTWVAREVRPPVEIAFDVAPIDADLDGDDEVAVVARGSDWILDFEDGAWRASWQSTRADDSRHVHVRDHDLDGTPDLLVDGVRIVFPLDPMARLYHAHDGDWIPTITLTSPGATGAAAFADLDGDGDPEVVALVPSDAQVVWNGHRGADLHATNPTRLALAWLDAEPFSRAAERGRPRRIDDGPLAVEVRLFDTESDPVDELRFVFRDFAGGWRPATVLDVPARWSTAPFTAGGVAHAVRWDWVADGADGEDVQLRAVVVRQVIDTGSARLGAVAAVTPGIRLFRDEDGDGVRDTTDPCPRDPSDDSLVAGVCDGEVLGGGWWCAASGGRGAGAGAVLLALALVRSRRRHAR